MRGIKGCEDLDFVFLELNGLQEKSVQFTEEGLLLDHHTGWGMWLNQRHQKTQL